MTVTPIKLPGDRMRFQKQSVAVSERPEGASSAAAVETGTLKSDWFSLLDVKDATMYVIPAGQIDVTLELAVGLAYSGDDVDFSTSDIVTLTSATIPAVDPITVPVTGLAIDVSTFVAPYIRVVGPDGVTAFTVYLWTRK